MLNPDGTINLGYYTQNQQPQFGMDTPLVGSNAEILSQGLIPGLSNLDALRGGLGIGQLGLGVLSYLDQSKTADAQRKLMKQQMEQNRFVIDQAKQRAKDVSGAFGGGGLAASTVSK